MAKLVNQADDLVDEALAGLAAAHGELLEVRQEPRFVLRRDAPISGQVALVSGGGSGHEPLHTGFVGPGMLTAAVPGEVFASPSAWQVHAALTAADGGAGVLMIVKNYTGDVMNFDMAAELAEADGVQVTRVLVADDVAVQDSTATVGRRGIAGTLAVEKLAGAAAEQGRPLDEVRAVAARAADGVRSMGLALSGVRPPQAAEATFSLDERQMEVGIGIHGEPGRERIDLAPLDEAVDRLLDAVVDELPDGPDDVLLLTNSLGATPPLELYAAHGRASAEAERRGLRVVRSLVGPYVTSLDMAGVSLTLLRLDEELLTLWDAPVTTPALRW